TRDVIEARNEVDRLDRAAEPARRVLSAAVFRGAATLSTNVAEACVADLRAAIRRADRSAASLLLKLFWPFSAGSRLRALNNASEEAASAFVELGYEGERPSTPALTLAVGEAFVDAAKAAKAYQEALKVLSHVPDLGALAISLSNRTKSLEAVSGEAWT